MPRWMSILCLLVLSANAAFVKFSNCLDSNVIRSNPRLLQFVPLNITATFNTTDPGHNLNVTFYGNVTGQSTTGTYPSPSDPSWSDPNSLFGKIPDLQNGASLYTTLFSTYNVLSYTPYTADPARFCNDTINEVCPMAPAFYVSRADLSRLPGWSVSHQMEAAYAFAEIVVTSRVQSGDSQGGFYACINAFLTPDFGQTIRDLIRYLPLVILIVVGIATITAAIFNPWGTWDIFRWSSNFGRDEDVLRLVTPGFGDCLQYLQFVVLTGSLSLNYPGFYQPAVSQVGWSSLLFNESFVTGGNGTNPIVDGLYQYRNASDSGLDRMTQLIGMTSPSDAWADMMVWLVVIIVAVAVLTQIGFALRWIYRKVMHIPAEDLRSKNWYFTVGNVIRLSFGFFLLPLLTLSFYQFVIANLGPTYAIALAAIVLVLIIAFSVRLVFLFARTRPRSFLFDDIQTVLAYGPLYNTYCDNTATFALIPILVNFLRAIAIGAVQASGVAQIVILAISEIILILTVSTFRPYPSATSMNLYHTCFAVLRILTVLLSVAFVPSLNVGYGTRGWIGYIILLIHACVMIFGFFLNAIQTLIEVIARRAGAGGSAGSDAARGGLVKVFGVRQLAKRQPRGGDNISRHSMASNAAMLTQIESEQKDLQMARTRSRSISASSQMLLDSAARNTNRSSQLYGNSDGQITPDAASTFSKHLARQSLPSNGIVGLQKPANSKDPYYRPPRRNTMDLLQSPDRTSMLGDSDATFNKAVTTTVDPVENRGEGSSTPLRIDDFDDPSLELTKTKTDYAVREVDFYYGVRGPALSSGTRKLKTGPADPTGKVSNATGWFKGLMGGRKKENSKGFEVVRSARAPPPGLLPPTEVEMEQTQTNVEPYRDTPLEGDTSSSQGRSSRKARQTDKEEDTDIYSTYSDDGPYPGPNIAAQPPSLPLIDTVGGIELPSRVGSEASKRTVRQKKPPQDADIPEVPALPRRNSRRRSSVDTTKNRLSVLGYSPSPVPGYPNEVSNGGTSRLPFTNAQNLQTGVKSGRHSVSNESAVSSVHDDLENQTVEPAMGGYTHHTHHPSTRISAGLIEERPNSIGYVREHRASDGITHHPGSVANHEAKSAEIHGPGGTVVQQPWSNVDLASGSPVNPYGQPGQRTSRFRD